MIPFYKSNQVSNHFSILQVSLAGRPDARKEGEDVSFYVYGLSRPLLTLRHIEEDKPDLIRDKFHIIGGLLSKTSNTGWLEFRIVTDGKYTLASINEFVPSLPWYIYKFTQAPIHAMVMNSFSEFLSEN